MTWASSSVSSSSTQPKLGPVVGVDDGDVRAVRGRRRLGLGVEVDQRLAGRTDGSQPRRDADPAGRHEGGDPEAAEHEQPGRPARRRLVPQLGRPGGPEVVGGRDAEPDATGDGLTIGAELPRLVERHAEVEDSRRHGVGGAAGLVDADHRRHGPGRVDGDELVGGADSGRLGQLTVEAGGRRDRGPVLEDGQAGRAVTRRDVELRAQRVEQTGRHRQRVGRGRVGSVDERHDDEADAERSQEPAPAQRGRRADLFDRRGERLVGLLIRGRPAIAEVEVAVVDHRHRDAVAQVVDRHREQPRIAQVEDPVVADRGIGRQLCLGRVDEGGARGRTRRRR